MLCGVFLFFLYNCLIWVWWWWRLYCLFCMVDFNWMLFFRYFMVCDCVWFFLLMWWLFSGLYILVFVLWWCVVKKFCFFFCLRILLIFFDLERLNFESFFVRSEVVCVWWYGLFGWNSWKVVCVFWCGVVSCIIIIVLCCVSWRVVLVSLDEMLNCCCFV